MCGAPAEGLGVDVGVGAVEVEPVEVEPLELEPLEVEPVEPVEVELVDVLAFTVMVAVALVEPREFVAFSVSVTVLEGFRVSEPLAATVLPFNVTVVAREVDHVMVLELPWLMLVGEAAMCAAGTR